MSKVVGYNIWKKVFYTITPGGDPLWECPICHNGRHVYGIECSENHTNVCRDCGAELMYPHEVEGQEDKVKHFDICVDFCESVVCTSCAYKEK